MISFTASLAPVTGLTFTTNSTHTKFTWQRPDTLQGIELKYKVQLSFKKDSTPANVTGTFFVFESIIDPCVLGVFSVTPTAGELKGRTKNITQYFPRGQQWSGSIPLRIANYLQAFE